MPNPYNKAGPVIEAIQSLIEIAPLSLEKLPDIENPFRVDETQVNLDPIASLNNLGAGITGGDLLSQSTIPDTGELPFDQLKTNQQKIAKGQSIFKDDIIFDG